MALLLAVLVRILGNEVLRKQSSLQAEEDRITPSEGPTIKGGSLPFSWYLGAVIVYLVCHLSPLLTDSSSRRISWRFLGAAFLWTDSIVAGERHRQSPSIEHGGSGWGNMKGF